MLAIGAISCSDNIDTDLEPTKSVRTLTITIDDKEIPNNTLQLGAAPSHTLVNVESNTRWTVEISDCLGGWCDIDVINGTGSGSFSISVLDNMKAERDCYVTIYKTDAQGNKETDGSIQLKVKQAVSDVRLSPSSLSPFAPDVNERQKFDIISNVTWTLDVTYETGNSTKFVTVTPASSAMKDNGDGTFSGDGAASFFIDLQSNRTAADRKAYLNLHSAVAEYSVELMQLKSQYTFDVSPAENQIVAAEGTSIEFGVLSLSDWSIACAADWISFSVNSGTSSESRVGTVATIEPNLSGTDRTAIIRFMPNDKSFPEQDVTVTQRGFDITFHLDMTDYSGLIPEDGGTFGIELDSRFDWVLTAPSWIHATPNSGNANMNNQPIGIQVDRNTANANRTGIVTITPMETKISDKVVLDPNYMGVGPIQIGVTQFGGHEPAISVPWLIDGYGQTYATVEFNYYSPFNKIKAAGLQWKKANSDTWNTAPATVTNATEGTISISLSNLDPATEYVARGFVVDDKDVTFYGTVSCPFTTAGVRPDAGDNPTPTEKLRRRM